VKHNGCGYGFKITFKDEEMACQMKQIIGSMLFKCFNGEVVVDSGGKNGAPLQVILSWEERDGGVSGHVDQRAPHSVCGGWDGGVRTMFFAIYGSPAIV